MPEKDTYRRFEIHSKFAEQISVEVGEQNVIFTSIIFFKIWKAKLSELSNLPQPQPLFNGTAVGLRGTSQHM